MPAASLIRINKDPSRHDLRMFAAVWFPLFCALVVFIHSTYGVVALLARSRIGGGAVLAKINKVGGVVFIAFAALLLYSAIH